MPGTLLGSEIWWWPRQSPDSCDAFLLRGDRQQRYGNTRDDKVATAVKPDDVTRRTLGARLRWGQERFCEETTLEL